MDLMLDIDIKPPDQPINFRETLLLTGSCFTEHIGQKLWENKFSLQMNPNGILFDTHSVARSLLSYIRPDPYSMQDIFQLNEIWHSWEHHSRFSSPDPEQCLSRINESQQIAHGFLQKAGWLIITLGTSFQYRLAETGRPVANCHRAPAQVFRKQMMTIEQSIEVLDNALHQLRQFNPGLRILFTVSPVRHIRDGVVENNRSKARLIETVHHLKDKFSGLYYFPAYELVIDVLRDYRFYDVDMVHPNYLATRMVMEKFIDSFLDKETRDLLEELQPILQARKHRAFHPGTRAHREFLASHFEKAKSLQSRYPDLNLNDELEYFSGANGH